MMLLKEREKIFFEGDIDDDSNGVYEVLIHLTWRQINYSEQCQESNSED